MTPPTPDPTGLTVAEINQLTSVLGQHPQVQRAVVFGSRAKGCARPNSDIDIALYGNLPDLLVERIADKLGQLRLPYLFDVITVANLQNPALLDHIQRVGFEIYAASGKHLAAISLART